MPLPFRDPAKPLGRGAEPFVDAEARHPCEIFPAVKKRQPLALPRRHAGFLVEVLQRAARPPRMELEALAAAAQADETGKCFRLFAVDTLATDPAKPQLAAQRGDL